MYEDGELSLAKLMRRMGALWTKTQAAKKGNVPQGGPPSAAGPGPLGDEQALRAALQSVTDGADVDAPAAPLGRGWQAGRGGGGGARPGRGRGAGRGRGGRVGDAPRAICQRCGGDYARTYLWSHQRRCVGNQDFAWGQGRGGARVGGAAEVALQEEPNNGVVEAGQEEPDGDEAEDRQEEVEDIWEEEEEESDHEDIFEELEDLERTVFGDDQERRRGRGQKRG